MTFSPQLKQQAIRQKLAAQGRTLERSSKIPVIPKCPSPTCECADMPGDLDIETSKDLNGTMAAYSQQILVSTGQTDWKSKIEDEKDTAPWGVIVAQVKAMLGPQGRFHDPYRNVVVSASSFMASTASTDKPQVLLFPSFQLVKDIDTTEDSIRSFIEAFIVSRPEQKTQNTQNRNSEWQGTFQPISTPTILICSHNSRDSRCGIVGPLLHTEFSRYINKRHTLRVESMSEVIKSTDDSHEENVHSIASHPAFRPDLIDPEHVDQRPINIGMISHIGGHKWAGNVIVYIPPDYKLKTLERSRRGAKPRDKIVAGGKEPTVNEYEVLSPEEEKAGLSPLAGKGIWYGRVEPKHVEGIVEQTIGHGQVIRELFRGGINRDGSSIRL